MRITLGKNKRKQKADGLFMCQRQRLSDDLSMDTEARAIACEDPGQVSARFCGPAAARVEEKRRGRFWQSVSQAIQLHNNVSLRTINI